ncbi:GyrI-like domain-containing protein [uncultured Sphaerochaeta sp.]|uniref:GyrI-like domain-containing protein n=1 Tax=uncultured Sphaerochaeta sp. TaxID=886478 RepID=UPI002A0A6A90|nr:GyrI-like domain-containing protein [uncultured Sphaerochaeta sp.]
MKGSFDIKKAFPKLYRPGTEPALVTVPPQPYFIMDGQGEPGGEEYVQSVEILYSLSYTLKMVYKEERWYRPFVVGPLEGVWTSWQEENRSLWKWSSMISQPEFANNEIFSMVQEQCCFKKKLPAGLARFAILEEGLCVTMLHIGPYSEEIRSFDEMEQFCQQNQIVRRNNEHREIYLSDPKKTEPAKLKTVLRFMVSRL